MTPPEKDSRWQERRTRRTAVISSAALVNAPAPRVEYRYEAPVPDEHRSPSRRRTGGHGPYVQTVTVPLADFLRRFAPVTEGA
jgi:hypothetical protein